MILAIITIGVAALAANSGPYSRLLDRHIEIDSRRPTPARERADGDRPQGGRAARANRKVLRPSRARARPETHP